MPATKSWEGKDRELLDKAIAAHLALDPFGDADEIPIEIFTASRRGLVALLDLKHGKVPDPCPA